MLLLAVRSFTTITHILLRTHHGTRFFWGWQTVGAYALTITWAGFYPKEHPGFMLRFHQLWTFMLIVRVLQMAKNRKERSRTTHSYYIGDSYISRRWFSAVTIDKIVEPLLVAAIGLTLSKFSVGLGNLFYACAAALVMENVLAQEYASNLRQQMTDSLIESRMMTGR